MIALLLTFLTFTEKPLTHGLVVEVYTECSYKTYEPMEFIHLDYCYLPACHFSGGKIVCEGQIEYDLGFCPVIETEYYDPHYWVRLKSGERKEWVEVDEWKFNEAVVGQQFDTQ